MLRLTVRLRIYGLLLIFGIFSVSATQGAVQAQDASDGSLQQNATSIRQGLFDAQAALMGNDVEAAVNAVEATQALYADSLHSVFSDSLDVEFEAALTAAQNGDTLSFAAARSRIWVGILRGSTELVLSSLAKGDTSTASEWLTLREYRPSTKFSRPSANATLAVNQLAAGEISTDQALTAVRADLFDTYQTQLYRALNAADEASTKGFGMRVAEEAGAAAGYFDLISSAYGEQYGTEALTNSRREFSTLVEAAITADSTAFQSARTGVESLLNGFRAAPLTDVEAARRAGQLTRFLTLVPIEYERGVRNGQVVNDIEIQEALTFHEGASVAFADLQSLLMKQDAEAVAQVASLLTQAEAQIRQTAPPSELQATIDTVNTTLSSLLPPEWQTGNADSDVDVILSVLDQVETAVKQGEYALAESARLEAYALLELGIEQRLRGFAPDKAIYIENLFWAGTPEHAGLSVLLGTNAAKSDVTATLGELRTSLTDAQAFLSSGNTAPEAVAGNAAVIVFREGLEAVLILASLLASLRTGEDRKFRRPLVIGGALAFAATAVTWWIAHQLLSFLLPYGETLEAIVSLIAIGVLILITNWFFHKVYWTGWMASFHSKKRQLVGGAAAVALSQTIGLIVLGFTSIYREGFETVLFLQSLVLEAGIGVVLRGVALGLVGVGIIGMITFSLQVRLPYKKMLIVTGVMIGVVLLTMVGNTVHVMQAIGWLPITPIQGVYLPYWVSQWLGIFATWQGILLQITAAVFVIGSYFLAEHQQKQRRTRPTQQAAEAA